GRRQNGYRFRQHRRGLQRSFRRAAGHALARRGRTPGARRELCPRRTVQGVRRARRAPDHWTAAVFGPQGGPSPDRSARCLASFPRSEALRRLATPISRTEHGGTMKVIAFDRFKPGVTMDTIRPLLPEEVEHAWRLWKRGIVRENYSRVDEAGVVL